MARDCFADPLLARVRGLTGLARGVGGRHRVARDLLHGGGHFSDSRRRLFDLVVLLLQVLRAVEGDRIQLVSRCRQLRRRAADTLQGFTQVVLHGRQRLEQATHFIVAMGFDGAGQVASCHVFRGMQRFAQRFDDAAGQQHGQADSGQRRQRDEQADDHSRCFVMRCGFLALGGDLFGEQIRQVM